MFGNKYKKSCIIIYISLSPNENLKGFRCVGQHESHFRLDCIGFEYSMSNSSQCCSVHQAYLFDRQASLPWALAVVLCLLSTQQSLHAATVNQSDEMVVVQTPYTADELDEIQLLRMDTQSTDADQQLIQQILQDAEANIAKSTANEQTTFQSSELQLDQAVLTAVESSSNEQELLSSDILLQRLDQQTLPEIVADVTAPTISASGEEIGVSAAAEQGWFSRVMAKLKPDNKFGFEEIPRISVETRIVGAFDATGLSNNDYANAVDKLQKNIIAKLSTFPQESFNGRSLDSTEPMMNGNNQPQLQQGFELAKPQLRHLANQAAQAVGFYQAQFAFTALSDRRVRVDIEPHRATLVTDQNIVFHGEGAKTPVFQVIQVVPELAVGDVFNHGDYEQTKLKINEASSNNGYFNGFWKLHDVRIDLDDNMPQPEAKINLAYETGERYKLGAVSFRLSSDQGCVRHGTFDVLRPANAIECTQDLPLDDDILNQLVPWGIQQNNYYTFWRVNTLAANLTNTRYFNYALVDAVHPDALEAQLQLPPDLEALVQQGKFKRSDFIDDKSIVPYEDIPLSNQGLNVDEDLFAGSQEPQERQDDLDQRQTKQQETELLKQYARQEKTVPVVVTINADQLNNAELGLGYGTDTGVRLRSQYRRAIVNRRGHSFDANLELSSISQSIDTHYNIPYHHPLNDYLSLVAGYEREKRDDVAKNNSLIVDSAVLGIDRIIKNPMRNWQENFGLRYRLDRLEQQGVVDDEEIPEKFRANGEQQSLLLGYEISRTLLNKRLNPTMGFKQTYKIELGAKAALSDANMAIVNAGWHALYSIDDEANHQVLGRVNLGYIFTDDFSHVPYNLRYFTGGDQTLRGFDYKSLSPEEAGYKIGGQAMAVGSAEYNYQFKPGWRGAVFSDFGNAYDKNFSNDLEYSLGVGLRWASPIGPIRVDVATGISDPDRPIRLHFFIGSTL